MKKIMIILMIMTACLASPVLADAPDDVTNSSFEDDTIVAGAADYWILWGQSAMDGLVYHKDDPANANTGNDYFEVGRGSDGWAGIHAEWGQEVAVTPGTDATMSAYARSADGTDQIGAFGLKIEFYATQGENWVEGSTPNVVEIIDVTGTYTLYSVTTTVPAGMFFARATITSEAAPVFVDDVNICIGSEPCDKDPRAATLVAPSPSGSFANPDGGTTLLEWRNPSPLDPNDTGVVTSDVWFVQGEADPSTGTQLLSGSTAQTVTSGAITPGNIYSWRVDCYDPNRADLGGSPVKTVGEVWTFNTTNTAPTAVAGYNENAWLNDGEAVVNLEFFEYNDNVDNYPGPLTRTLTTTGGTFDVDPTTGEDPNTITFTAAGVYTITLTVKDGPDAHAQMLTSTDSFVVTVYPADTAENYLVAHYPFDTDASDASSNGHHGTLVGDAAISGADTQVGAGALSLDGNGDWVSITDSVDAGDASNVTWADFITPIGSDPNNQLTIAVWIKPSVWSIDWTQVVSKGYPGAYRITRPNYNSVFFTTDMPWANGDVWGGGEYSMNDGEWHHVVATWDGGAGALYIDGNYQYRQPQAHGTLLIKNTSELQIGANADADSSQHFRGLIDDVRIYDVGLSHAEVLKLYASQGGSGTCGKVYAAVDYTQDCVINIADFAVFAFEWFDCRDIFTCP